MWPRIANLAIGIWLMAAPTVLGFGRPTSTNAHIVGPLIATFACIAIWEATRSVRWINLPLGLWLALAPAFLNHSQSATINTVLCGIGVASLSCFGGKVQQRFAGGWSAIWRGVPTE